MTDNFEACPYCGKKIMKGAMRCMGCGKILKTAQEQQASIDRYKKSKETPFMETFIKILTIVIILAALGLLYRNYGDEIISIVRSMRSK